MYLITGNEKLDQVRLPLTIIKNI